MKSKEGRKRREEGRNERMEIGKRKYNVMLEGRKDGRKENKEGCKEESDEGSHPARRNK